MKRSCIWGAGAMGTLLGAALTQTGCPVDLVEASRSRAAHLSGQGVTVSGTLEFQGAIPVYTPDQLTGAYDLVLLLTKQVHNAVAFPQIEAHIHGNSLVCTLQNGVPESSVAEFFGEARTLGCAVTWAATVQPDGSTLATTRRALWHSTLGRPDGQITDGIRWTASILEHMCPTRISGNLTGIRWSKLLVNSSFSGMSAALGATFGEILDHPEALRCAQHIARECIRTARAQNIRMEPLGPGEDFERLMDFRTQEERLATRHVYRRLWGGAREGVASMLPDLQNHRATEIDYINGYLSQCGRQCGVPTPYTDTVVSIVRQCEAGHMSPGIENVGLFPQE